MAAANKFKLGSKTARDIRYDSNVQHAQRRRAKRSEAFDRGRELNLSLLEDIEEDVENRNPPEIPSIAEPAPGPSTPAAIPPKKVDVVKDSRLAQLKNWKEKKEREKKMAQLLKKPAFKAGVVHHTMDVKKYLPAPVLASSKRLQAANVSPVKAVQGRKGATTRNMTKNKGKSHPELFGMISLKTKFTAPKGLNPLPLTVPRTPRGMADRKKAISTSAMGFLDSHSHLPSATFNMVSSARKPVKFSALASMLTAAPKGTPRRKNSILPDNDFETISEEPESDTAKPDPELPTVQYPHSPFVTVRRGKGGAHCRRSSHSNKNPEPVATSSKNPDLLPDMEVVQDAAYFRSLLAGETARLEALCVMWTDSKLPTLSADNTNQIDAVVGLTRLLIRSKFQQFRTLIGECEAGTCIPPVLCEDLLGFWDMMRAQVVGLDKDYAALDTLKNNGWSEVEPTPVEHKQKPKKAKKKQPQALPKRKTGIKEMVLAKRKKLLDDQRLEDSFTRNERLIAEGELDQILGTPEGTSKRRSLMQQALMASTRQRVSKNSPIMMRVSQVAKRMSGCVRLNEEEVPANVFGSADNSLAHSVGAISIDNVPRTTRRSQSLTAEEGDKENSEAVIKSGPKKPAVNFSMECTPSPTPVVRPLRRQTPFRRAPVEDDDVESESEPSTPIKTPRRSMRFTPFQGGYSEGRTRVSLLAQPMFKSPVAKPLASGDLICFDSPLRRSHRIGSLKQH